MFMRARFVYAVAAATGAAGCSTFLDLREPSPPAILLVTVDSAMVAGTEDLSSFPLLVRTVGHADLRSIDAGGGVSFQDGSDLIFELAGTRLAREIEHYDPSSGALVAWVLVPTLSASTDTVLELRYGGAASAAASVWGDYAGVWHLAQDPFTEVVVDSSPTAAHGTASGFTTSGRSVAVAGFGVDFDGGQRRIELGNPAGLEMAALSFTFSAWVRSPAPVREYDMPFYKGGSSMGYPGYDFELGANGWGACVNDGTGSSSCAGFGDEPNLSGSWHLLSLVVDRDGGELRAYVDGAETGVTPVPALGDLSGGIDAAIGNDSIGGGYPFAGTLDEIRIARTARSSDWLLTEFANIDSAGFVVVGP